MKERVFETCELEGLCG